jgi:hypothetical protein
LTNANGFLYINLCNQQNNKRGNIMDIKKLKEELAKMPKYGFKGNMLVGKPKPLPLKYGKPITQMIIHLAKKLQRSLMKLF